MGVDAINARLVTLQILEEIEIDPEEAETADEDVEAEQPVEAQTP